MSEVPVYPGVAVGFRFWSIYNDLLHPILNTEPGDGFWRPGPNEAYCRWSTHRSPQQDCECGLYAYFDVAEMAEHYWRWEPFMPGIRGAIAGWGEVQLHADGFRAEHAQVLGLVGVHDADRRVADFYGVPLFAEIDQLHDYVAKIDRLRVPA